VAKRGPRRRDDEAVRITPAQDFELTVRAIHRRRGPAFRDEAAARRAWEVRFPGSRFAWEGYPECVSGYAMWRAFRAHN
jgi:hypothetical protein